MMARKVVVLPTPLRPSSAAHSPCPTCRLTPCRMCNLPMCTCTSSRLSMQGFLDVVLVLFAAQVGLAHPLIGGNGLRPPRGQNSALRHDGDVVGDLEYDIHVMLDDDHVDRARELANLGNRTRG